MSCKKPLIWLNWDRWSLIQMMWHHMLNLLTILKVCLLKELIQMWYWLKDQVGGKSTSWCFPSWSDKADEMWVGCKRLASHLWPTCVYNFSHHPVKVRSPEHTWCGHWTPTKKSGHYSLHDSVLSLTSLQSQIPPQEINQSSQRFIAGPQPEPDSGICQISGTALGKQS